MGGLDVAGPRAAPDEKTARTVGESREHRQRMLNQRGIYTRIRDSAGQEVEGACGQLRARAMKKAA